MNRFAPFTDAELTELALWMGARTPMALEVRDERQRRIKKTVPEPIVIGLKGIEAPEVRSAP